MVLKPILYLDAARRMRPSQVLMRSRRLIPPTVLALGTTPSSTPGWRPIAEGLAVDPAPQSGPTPPPHETGAFTAFGASRRMGSPGFWSDSREGLLFLFHLHGFSALAAYAASGRTKAGDTFWATVTDDWLTSEAKPRLPSWHPYPTSVRLMSWCAALAHLDWPSSLRDRVAREICRQARYLRRSIEYDIGGNHVLKNATALIFAGAVVPSSGVLDAGLNVLRHELQRQILTDGGHEERSTSYHRAVAHDLAEVEELLGRTRDRRPDWLSTAARRTASWRAVLSGPDGRLPLLNDAWEGPAEPSRRQESLTVLAESGYVVFRNKGDQVVFDVGPLSPPHLPPHGHADALSFVLWVDGRPLITDPGSYAYTGPWRNHFRATAAHNTVEIDGRDQCELWSDFRIGYPPRVRLLTLRGNDEALIAIACHDGYRRLRDPVEHHRAFLWLPGKGVIIIDRLRARAVHRVRSRLHVAPGASVDGTTRIGPLSVTPLGRGAAVRRISGAYAPFLGRKIDSTVIEDVRTVERDAPFGWSLLRSGIRVTRFGINRVDVEAPGQRATSIRLDWDRSCEY